MSIKLDALKDAHRVLFNIPLRPVQGARFQPTGFPSLGAATYQTQEGASLLVESAQSLANRLEAVIWDGAAQKPVAAADGISYIRVERKGGFLTSSILEAHRINSPYLLESKEDKSFFDELKTALGGLAEGPINRRLLTQTLFKYDVNALIHGVFLAKKDLAGGRLRIARALSAFIEADDVKVAASGGVKNDSVNPQGDTKTGFGNVPFSRDEYTAKAITLYVNLDLDQIRGYGLDDNATYLLLVLALYKVRALLSGALRLRTACDLEVAVSEIIATRPAGFALPTLEELAAELRKAIAANAAILKQTTVKYEDELTKGKSGENETAAESQAEDSDAQ
jgi:CRISPR-associated protein Csb1